MSMRPTWDDVVRDHSARVYRHAYRLTGNQQDAEDLAQDVFVRVFRSLDTFQPGSLEGWLHRITTNLFLDRMRRNSRVRFDAFAHGAEERLASTAPTPEDASSDSAFDADIETALARLSEEFRVAVVLCDVEEMSYDEIAAALDVKLGTVRSRIHRGRLMLRKELAHRAPGAGRSRAGGPLDLGPATA
jgi:RNA polymerase sigma-70 factor (ECF subfamily)